MILSDDQFKKLKQVELEIFKEIDRVCRKNNIAYSMTAGTLLGAVRHKGFIPWDDDIDLCMTRENYEKFKKVALTDLDPKYYVVDHNSNKYLGTMFGKVMKKNTVLSDGAYPKKVPSCIFVDIFIADKTSTNQKEQYKQYKKIWSLRRIFLRRQSYRYKTGSISRILYRLSGLVLKIIPASIIRKKHDNNCLKFANEKDYQWILYCVTTKFSGSIYSREDFEEYTELSFEGIKFMSIKNYEKMLRHQFGDYMKLPPEDQRVPQHAVKKIDFGE